MKDYDFSCFRCFSMLCDVTIDTNLVQHFAASVECAIRFMLNALPNCF